MNDRKVELIKTIEDLAINFGKIKMMSNKRKILTISENITLRLAFVELAENIQQLCCILNKEFDKVEDFILNNDIPSLKEYLYEDTDEELIRIMEDHDLF